MQNEVLADIFAHTAQTLPDKTALIEADKTLSYGELYQQALIMAQHLALKGKARSYCRAMAAAWY